MSKRTLVLILVLIIVTTILVAVAVKPQSTPTTPPIQQTTKAIPTPAPVAYSVLSFNPNPLTVSPASTSSSINIDLDADANAVTAVQLEMQYDPKVLKNVDIALSSFFKNPIILLKKVDPATGRISFAFGINPNGTAQKGKGTIATLMFQIDPDLIGVDKQSTEAETAISFLPKTLITAEGISQSVLKSSVDAKILLNTK